MRKTILLLLVLAVLSCMLFGCVNDGEGDIPKTSVLPNADKDTAESAETTDTDTENSQTDEITTTDESTGSEELWTKYY